MSKPISESEARQQTVCVGCGQPKDVGLVVCWDCFKYTDQFTPLKYYGGSFQQWQIHAIHSRERSAS